MNKKGATLAIGAGLLYLLWDHLKGGAPSDVPFSGPNDWTKIHLDYCVGDAATKFGGRYILTDLMPDAIPVEAEKAALEKGQSMYGHTLGSAMHAFYHQVQLPASRVKVEDLQPYHFQLANGMVGSLLQRNDKAGRLYQVLLSDIAQNKKTAEDLAIADAVVSTVASIIPVIGGAIAVAASTGIKEGQKGATQNALRGITSAMTVDQIKTGLGVNSPEGKAWFHNDASERPIDGKYVTAPNGVKVDVCSIGLTELGGFYHDSLGNAVGQASAKYAKKVTTNGYTREELVFRDGYGFQPVACRMRFFSMHRYGWIQPWLSSQLGVDGHRVGPDGKYMAANASLHDIIALHAPVLRALDYMCVKIDPLPLGGGYPGHYWYVNPTFGPVYGSIFPPGPNDKPFRDGLRMWGYDGVETLTTEVSIGSGDVVFNKTSALDKAQSSVTFPGQQTTDESDDRVPAVPEDYGQAAQQDAARAEAASAASNSTVTSVTRNARLAAQAKKGLPVNG